MRGQAQGPSPLTMGLATKIATLCLYYEKPAVCTQQGRAMYVFQHVLELTELHDRKDDKPHCISAC